VFDPETFGFQCTQLVNLSGGGVSLLLAHPVSEGGALWVEIYRRGRSRTLPVRVRHVQRCGDGWLHGCKLAVPLSPAELRALVEESVPGLKRYSRAKTSGIGFDSSPSRGRLIPEAAGHVGGMGDTFGLWRPLSLRRRHGACSLPSPSP
jgi:hypothetical protein